MNALTILQNNRAALYHDSENHWALYWEHGIIRLGHTATLYDHALIAAALFINLWHSGYSAKTAQYVANDRIWQLEHSVV